jgi:hypothetical protein
MTERGAPSSRPAKALGWVGPALPLFQRVFRGGTAREGRYGSLKQEAARHEFHP